jgi:hypothetical protein
VQTRGILKSKVGKKICCNALLTALLLNSVYLSIFNDAFSCSVIEFTSHLNPKLTCTLPWKKHVFEMLRRLCKLKMGSNKVSRKLQKEEVDNSQISPNTDVYVGLVGGVCLCPAFRPRFRYKLLFCIFRMEIWDDFGKWSQAHESVYWATNPL